MISLMSVRSQSGLYEWKCSTCQYVWEAQNPFSGCPKCPLNDGKENQTLQEDDFTLENIITTEYIGKRSVPPVTL